MTFSLQTTDDLGGSGTALMEAGTFHFAIVNMLNGVGPKGNPMDGFCAGLSVLAGTATGQEKKEMNLSLFNPKLSAKESAQQWSIKKQTAFLVAAGLIDPKDLGGQLEVELKNAVGGQIIMTVDHQEDENGKLKKFPDLMYANIYHVDDPRAENFPKSAVALNVIPSDLRKPPEYFAPILKGDPASAGKKTVPALEPAGSGNEEEDVANDL